MKVFEINKEITKYSFGSPMNTASVVLNEGPPLKKREIDYFDAVCSDTIILKYTMDIGAIIYGLGENQRGINKRGGLYHSYCADDPLHTPDKKSMYGAHNYLIVYGTDSFGIFVDFPGRVTFDAGFTDLSILEITICGSDADVYIIKGSGARDITRSFLKLVGPSYAPPKWAFGYQQSRWSYNNASEVEELAESFLQNDIPCDAIYLDIDYMKDFKDFTVDSGAFPDFSDFVVRMKEKGFRLVPIIDAGVKIEEGYDVYEEGIAEGYFCMDGDNKPFVAAVWPGKVHFPDFFKAEARSWFGTKYKRLTDCGIEGFWNDMNEPAIFYTERGLDKAIEKAKASAGKNLGIYEFFSLKDAFGLISNNPEDYGSFYHDFGGKPVCHDKVHNLYGYFMTRAAAEGLSSIVPGKRFLLFSRASCIGMHRYSGIWTGDNHSWWEHLLLNIKMMPSINMCGFLYCGADTGGFSGDANAELLIRWMQFSIFSPLFRNHSALGTRRQEPFTFEKASTGIMRNIIKLRYSLVPYLYSEYMKAVIDGDVYFAPLSFEYQDEFSKRVEDQLLVGKSLMICPVYSENSRGRYVWMPEEMLLWKASDYISREYKLVGAGHQYIEAGLEEVPVFIRKNSMLVIGSHASNIDNLDRSELQVIAFVEDKAEYLLYDDDGVSYDYVNGATSGIKIVIVRKGPIPDIRVIIKGMSPVKRISFEIIGTDGIMLSAVLTEDSFCSES